MAKRPFQFGLLTLFVLTTAVAIALAVTRLPIERYWKVYAVAFVASCFSYWRKRERGDEPAATDIAYSSLSVATALTLVTLFAILAVERTWHYELASSRFTRGVMVGVLFLAVAIGHWMIITRIWRQRSA